MYLVETKKFPGHPKAKVYHDQVLPVWYSIQAKNISLELNSDQCW